MGKAGYEYLITYQYSIEIYDVTVEFAEKFLPGREHVRTREQMVQAARSCKQNTCPQRLARLGLRGGRVVEGYTPGGFPRFCTTS